jgi:hypothetical protein
MSSSGLGISGVVARMSLVILQYTFRLQRKSSEHEATLVVKCDPWQSFRGEAMYSLAFDTKGQQSKEPDTRAKRHLTEGSNQAST